MIEYKNELPAIEAYWPLFLSTGWNEKFNLDQQALEKAIQNSTFYVSAYEDERLVGFARAMSDRVMYAAIYDVMVLPEYKKRGIGKKLVENITQQCRECGVYSVHLFAASGTEPFYQKLGYTPAELQGMRYEG